MRAFVLPNARLTWLAALVVALGALSTASPALAQSNCASAAASEPASTAEERRERLQNLTDDLNSADPVVRLSTLETALLEGSAAERRFALQTGLASSDSTMQDIALRIGFCSIRTIIVQLERPDPNTDPLFFEYVGGSIRFNISEYDQNTGSFKSACPLVNVNGEVPKEDGQVSGNNISMSCLQIFGNDVVNCSTALTLDSEGALAGRLSCSPGAGNFEASASLF